MNNRIAKSIVSTSNNYVNFGTPSVKTVSVTTKMVSIDDKYSVTQQSFIQKLATNNRISYKFYTKGNDNYTEDFLTRLLNENGDLFPVEM